MLWILFAAGALIAYWATAITIKVSLHRGVLDVPNDRSSHTLPVPRIGGLGIVSGFYLSLTALFVLVQLGLVHCETFSWDILLILFAGAGMAATGLMDDLYHLKQTTKFLMQLIITMLVVAYGIRLEIVAIPAWRVLDLGVLSFPLTILWLTGFPNIYNFMDGINGLSTGTGAVYCVFFFLFAWFEGNAGLAAIAILLLGCCLGFLFHNFPVAHTFMGDSGSLFLGMVFALLVVRLAQLSHNPASLIALLLTCSVYLYDSTFTLLRRLKLGENIFRAHRRHFYQRLAIAGLTHVMITNLYLFMHALMGGLAILYFLSSGPIQWWILGIVSVIFLVFTLEVHRIENRAAKSKTQIGDNPAGLSISGRPQN